MAIREQFERLWISLASLGRQRLALLGIVGVAVFATIGAGAYYLSRPSLETLYSGLNREDIGRIGVALREANIPFDVSADGTSLLVAYGKTAPARMLLAEKGLPQSAKSGYELFNDLGSLGLTSFMQEVTKVRALQGELARTIQSMNGVKSARVHIVLPDRGSFRSSQQSPSASVVIHTEPPEDASSAQAIRHLVAAAVPGLKPDRVSVMNTSGVILTSGEDGAVATNGAMAKLEKGVSSDIQDSVRRTLAPYLGVGNFEISVAARLNTDRIQTTETHFDPDSRVERSIRSVKETENSQNRQGQKPATVQQNIPEQDVKSEGNDNSSSESQRREDTTNYEVSSKTVQTVSDGYSIKNMSLAVVVNRGRLTALLGEKATPADLDAKVIEIEQLVASAAGFDKSRGDQIKVAAVAFSDPAETMPEVSSPTVWEIMARQFGTIVNALALILVCALVIWFGLRPAVKMLLARNQAEIEQSRAIAALAASPENSGEALEGVQSLPPAAAMPALPNIQEGMSAQRRLEHVVGQSEEKAAAVLRKWLLQEVA